MKIFIYWQDDAILNFNLKSNHQNIHNNTNTKNKNKKSHRIEDFDLNNFKF